MMFESAFLLLISFQDTSQVKNTNTMLSVIMHSAAILRYIVQLHSQQTEVKTPIVTSYMQQVQ
jgi:hypothetical protein